MQRVLMEDANDSGIVAALIALSYGEVANAVQLGSRKLGDGEDESEGQGEVMER